MAKITIPGWIRGQSIGRGGQAQVFQATKDPDDGNQYAVKILNRDDKNSQAYGRFCREIEALKKLDHPNIVKIVDSSRLDSSGPFFYVMEYVPNAKTLKKMMEDDTNPFKHEQVKAVKMFLEIVQAIRACEAVGIVHRDLSPGNILVLSDRQIKIIDFGCCHMMNQPSVTFVDENVGTQNYRAPECEAGGDGPIVSCADLYSAGKILWAALVGQHAFARERPVFEGYAMRTIFSENPVYWHIQPIFNKTIRHKVSDRWSDGRTASFQTRQILNLIKCKEIPFELLPHVCSFCKTGKLNESTRRPLFPRSDVPQIGPRQPGGGMAVQDEGVLELVCGYCGHLSFIEKKIWHDQIEEARNYR